MRWWGVFTKCWRWRSTGRKMMWVVKDERKILKVMMGSAHKVPRMEKKMIMAVIVADFSILCTLWAVLPIITFKIFLLNFFIFDYHLHSPPPELFNLQHVVSTSHHHFHDHSPHLHKSGLAHNTAAHSSSQLSKLLQFVPIGHHSVGFKLLLASSLSFYRKDDRLDQCILLLLLVVALENYLKSWGSLTFFSSSSQMLLQTSLPSFLER